MKPVIVDDETHLKIKVAAAISGKSMGDVVNDALAALDASNGAAATEKPKKEEDEKPK